FDRGVVRARETWDDYREVATGGGAEQQLWAGFETIRAAWLEVTGDLGVIARGATEPGEAAATAGELLSTAQARFDVMRDFAGRIDTAFYDPAIQVDAPRLATETHRLRVALMLVVLVGL